ncbi:transposase [Roseibium sp. TrichSKD4]|uniref:transposase n=1 Tax=Roseibium sp. TrichSKD4 TaxID=744980 RepID=UPI0011129DF0
MHARTDDQGLPLSSVLTGGEASDFGTAPNLLNITCRKPRLFPADKGHDGDVVRQSQFLAGISPVIPPKSNRKRANCSQSPGF